MFFCEGGEGGRGFFLEGGRGGFWPSASGLKLERFRVEGGLQDLDS